MVAVDPCHSRRSWWVRHEFDQGQRTLAERDPKCVLLQSEADGKDAHDLSGQSAHLVDEFLHHSVKSREVRLGQPGVWSVKAQVGRFGVPWARGVLGGEIKLLAEVDLVVGEFGSDALPPAKPGRLLLLDSLLYLNRECEEGPQGMHLALKELAINAVVDEGEETHVMADLDQVSSELLGVVGRAPILKGHHGYLRESGHDRKASQSCQSPVRVRIGPSGAEARTLVGTAHLSRRVDMRALSLAAGLGIACAGLSACSPLSATVDFQTVPAHAESRASLVALPAGPDKVAPSERIVVTAKDGQLASVTVTGPKGKAVPGGFSADGATWTATQATLDYASTYSISATAVDSRGVPVSTQVKFTTAKPEKVFSAWISPQQGSVVGMGMPISVGFDRDIAVADRAAIEHALVVRTATPQVGAWSWTGPREVRFRPVNYWPGNSQVQVQANLTGVQLEGGVMGAGNVAANFAIGPAMLTKVDALTHQAQVFRDGTLIRTIPVTTGKPGFDTRSGTVVITTKEPIRIMDAATGGTDPTDPEYYRIEVHWAMRITSSGEFLHAAPWSVYAQGKRNVSHGCIGMGTDNAQWLFDRSNVGDVVEISGTPLTQDLGNGITVWMNTWDQWLADSAIGPVTTAPLDSTQPAVAIPTPAV